MRFIALTIMLAGVPLLLDRSSFGDSTLWPDDPYVADHCKTVMANSAPDHALHFDPQGRNKNFAPPNDQLSEESCWSRAMSIAFAAANPKLRTVSNLAFLRKCSRTPDDTGGGGDPYSSYLANFATTDSTGTHYKVCTPDAVFGAYSDQSAELENQLTRILSDANNVTDDFDQRGWYQKFCQLQLAGKPLNPQFDKLAADSAWAVISEYGSANMTAIEKTAYKQGFRQMPFQTLKDAEEKGGKGWEGVQCKLKTGFYEHLCQNKSVLVSPSEVPSVARMPISPGKFHDNPSYYMNDWSRAMKSGQTPLLSLNCYEKVMGTAFNDNADCSGSQHMVIMFGMEARKRNGSGPLQCGVWVRNSWGKSACGEARRLRKPSRYNGPSGQWVTSRTRWIRHL